MSDGDEDYTDTRQRRQSRGKTQGSSDLLNTYAWEEDYKRSWDVVQEDASGSLAGVVAGLVEAGKRKRLLRDTTPLQRGIIRHFILVLDMTSAMLEKDLRPSRKNLTLQYSKELINEYYEQNPISQLAIIVMRDGIAIKATELSGNPQDHITALNRIQHEEASGSPSLQNALEMARATLFHVPSHGTRETLIIFGSLLSADPGDIYKTIRSLVEDRVRVRMIGLAAQVAVCREICRATNDGNDS